MYVVRQKVLLTITDPRPLFIILNFKQGSRPKGDNEERGRGENFHMFVGGRRFLRGNLGPGAAWGFKQGRLGLWRGFEGLGLRGGGPEPGEDGKDERLFGCSFGATF